MSKRNWALSKWRERQQKDFLGILLTSHVRSVSSASEAGEGEEGASPERAGPSSDPVHQAVWSQVRRKPAALLQVQAGPGRARGREAEAGGRPL